MAVVWIPSLLRPMCDDAKTLDAMGATVGEALEGLCERFPALRERLFDGGDLRGDLSVSVDGEIAALGLSQPLTAISEIHLLPAMSGGAGPTRWRPLRPPAARGHDPDLPACSCS